MPELRRLLAALGLAATVVGFFCCAPVFGAASAPGGDDAQLGEGRALFTGGATPPCAICHTLKDAGATGSVGPSLDEVRPDEERVRAAVRGGIGAMPSFAATLTDAQIRAVARYVARASGGAG